jgi:hypothetical protein
MSADSLDRYRKLITELLIAREVEGGTLPEELESFYVERLDELWWSLSETEQKEYEAELAGAVAPAGPEDLDLVDCDVKEGDKTAPRKAA